MPLRLQRLLTAHTLVLIALLVLAVLPLWLVRFLPFGDYPQWLFEGHLLRLAVSAPERFFAAYTFTFAPVPNSTTSIMMWLLGTVFGSMETGGKLYLTLVITTVIIGAARYIRTVQRKPTLAEFLPFLFVYGYFTYAGYVSYFWALGLALLALSVIHTTTRAATHNGTVGWGGITLITVLGVLTYFTHLFGWLILLLGTVVYALSLHRQRRSMFKLLLTLVPVVVLLAIYTNYGERPADTIHLYDSLASKLIVMVEPLLVFLRLDPFDLIVPAPLVLNAVVLIVCFGLYLWQVQRPIIVASRPAHNTALLCVLVAAVLPFTWFLGLVHPGERFVLPAVLIGLAALPLRSPRALPVAAIIVVILMIFAVNVVQLQTANRYLETVYTATQPSFASGEGIFSISLRQPPLYNTCRQPAWYEMTVGIQASQWFDMMNFIASDGSSATIFQSGFIQHHAADPVLLIGEYPRDDLAHTAQRIRDDAEGYTWLHVYGCPDDLGMLAARVEPTFTTTEQGAGYRIFRRQ